MENPSRGEILVVDDSFSMRAVIINCLKEAGMSCMEAKDGKEALQMAEENKISLLITDINMPKMDGITLTQNVKAMPGYRFLKVLIITTEYQEELKEKAREAGASGWITKPVTKDKLLTAVKKFRTF